MSVGEVLCPLSCPTSTCWRRDQPFYLLSPSCLHVSVLLSFVLQVFPCTTYLQLYLISPIYHICSICWSFFKFFSLQEVMHLWIRTVNFAKTSWWSISDAFSDVGTKIPPYSWLITDLFSHTIAETLKCLFCLEIADRVGRKWKETLLEDLYALTAIAEFVWWWHRGIQGCGHMERVGKRMSWLCQQGCGWSNEVVLKCM